MIAQTPKPPYYVVIFTSVRSNADSDYDEMAERMVGLSAAQDGFLGLESARENTGITVSYWADLASIKKWQENTSHLEAQRLGKQEWYSKYKVRIAKVERDYEFEKQVN